MKRMIRLAVLAVAAVAVLMASSCKSEKQKISEKYVQTFNEAADGMFNSENIECSAEVVSDGICLILKLGAPIFENMDDNTQEMITSVLKAQFAISVFSSLSHDEMLEIADNDINVTVHVIDSNGFGVDFTIPAEDFREFAADEDSVDGLIDFGDEYDEDDELVFDDEDFSFLYEDDDELLLDSDLQPDTALVF